jgi:hypothetical protein
MREQLGVLECAADARARDPVGRDRGDVPSVE